MNVHTISSSSPILPSPPLNPTTFLHLLSLCHRCAPLCLSPPHTTTSSDGLPGVLTRPRTIGIRQDAAGFSCCLPHVTQCLVCLEDGVDLGLVVPSPPQQPPDRPCVDLQQAHVRKSKGKTPVPCTRALDCPPVDALEYQQDAANTASLQMSRVRRVLDWPKRWPASSRRILPTPTALDGRTRRGNQLVPMFNWPVVVVVCMASYPKRETKRL